MKPTIKKIIDFKKNKDYPLINNIPSFLNSNPLEENTSKESFREKLSKSTNFKKIKDIHYLIGPPGFEYTPKIPLKNKLISESNLSLNIGAGNINYPNTINLDVRLIKGVDILADAKNLPFKDNSFNLVLLESVLEHIDEPEKVINESYRVLKKKGKIFISIPFVYIFHGSPNDFNRMTIRGIESRLRLAGFKIKKLEILSGPGSTLSQSLRYYLAILFSFNNNFLFSFFLNFFGWLTFPIKYTDVLLNKYKKAHILANSIYAIAEK